MMFHSPARSIVLAILLSNIRSVVFLLTILTLLIALLTGLARCSVSVFFVVHRFLTGLLCALPAFSICRHFILLLMLNSSWTEPRLSIQFIQISPSGSMQICQATMLPGALGALCDPEWRITSVRRWLYPSAVRNSFRALEVPPSS